jgi:hypothetical protein
MSSISPTGVLSIAAKLYRLLLLIYPADHRRKYGPSMTQVFCDLCRDSYRQKGLAGVVWLWLRVLPDTAVTAALEHYSASREGDRLMTKKQHCTAIAFTGFPLALWLILVVINPGFVGRMVTPARSPAQPVGWILTGTILVLVTMTYVAQRWAFALANQPASNHVAGKAFLRNIIFMCSIVFIALPATLLVLFGPAIVTVLEAGIF